MAEDWLAVAGDVTSALDDVGFDVLVTRKVAPGLAWEAPSGTPPGTGTIKVVDSGISLKRDPTTGEKVQMRTLLAGIGTYAPTIGDIVALRGRDYAVLDVEDLAPGGTSVGYNIRVSV